MPGKCDMIVQVAVKPAKVKITQRRETVQVSFKDSLYLEAPVGTSIQEFLVAVSDHDPIIDPDLMMGGILDGRLRELAYPVNRDATLEPVMLTSSDGGRIYRRSLIMLMATAAGELWPGVKISVRYSIPEGGFYCKPLNQAPFSEDELQQLDVHMRQIVAEDAPISKRIAAREEAASLFASRGEDDKTRLLEQRTRNDLTLYGLHDREDYYYGYMLPSTRFLQFFRLIRVDGGFILQYPRKENPTDLSPISQFSKLVNVFRQADNWLAHPSKVMCGRLRSTVRRLASRPTRASWRWLSRPTPILMIPHFMMNPTTATKPMMGCFGTVIGSCLCQMLPVVLLHLRSKTLPKAKHQPYQPLGLNCHF